MEISKWEPSDKEKLRWGAAFITGASQEQVDRLRATWPKVRELKIRGRGSHRRAEESSR
jgi:hypothetical protein